MVPLIWLFLPELVRTASDFHTKLETLTAKMMEDTEHPRAKRIRVSNGELYRMNNNKGQHSGQLNLII